MQSASPGFSRIARAQATALLTMLRWVRVAPFGAPVVPEVNWMLIGSRGLSPPGDRVEAPALGAAAPVHDLVEAEAPRRRIGAELDDGAERRQARGAQPAGPAPIELRGELPDHLDVGGGLELPCGDERLRADSVEGVFELRGPIRGVDVDEDQPDARGGELGDHPLGPVRRPDSDPVSLVQAETQESGRETVHPPSELLVGPALAGGAEHRGGARTVTLHRFGEERGKGRLDKRPVGGSPDMGQAVDGGDAPPSESRLHHHFSRQLHSCSVNTVSWLRRLRRSD